MKNIFGVLCFVLENTFLMGKNWIFFKFNNFIQRANGYPMSLSKD